MYICFSIGPGPWKWQFVFFERNGNTFMGTFLADMSGNKPETLASTLDALGPRQALDLTDLTIKTHSADLITKHIY